MLLIFLKKGSRNISVNYRPVSLTLLICKLLHSIIRDHMVDFLSKHKLLIHFQNGFLKLGQETKGRSGRSSFKLEINLSGVPQGYLVFNIHR